MSISQLPAGITQHTAKTARLAIAYLEAGSGNIPIVLVHGNCSSSLFFLDFMLALAAGERYKVYAPDMRGFGASETLPVDATRGVRDFSDDLASFAQALELTSFHLLGWSLGGNIVIQYALDYPGKLRSLTLEAPGSPFGFGGTKGLEGSLTCPDGAGSGGGMINPAFVKRLAQGDCGSEQSSPRTVMNSFYFKPPFRLPPEREEIYLAGLLSTRVRPGNYPGDSTPSAHWPGFAPGSQGVVNTVSPKYMNQGNFAHIRPKPPVLWVHGTDDPIIADMSLSDIGFLGQLGMVPGWPGIDVYPPQPMVSQTRLVLDNYQANGGQYREVIIAACAHTAHVEKQAEFLRLFSEFVDASEVNQPVS
jgi:pimeloyl-ACP methyl ester carboxylesterase